MIDNSVYFHADKVSESGILIISPIQHRFRGVSPETFVFERRYLPIVVAFKAFPAILATTCGEAGIITHIVHFNRIDGHFVY
ncbi:hypothetical protein SDC9_73016 [bioreactor metagenome]|uniref:Uncharacterized protein n=1 Tax=bioreactor metagenome TaxID=1076179 RepID=A0A644YCY8_9ZZZZ